MTTTLRVTLDIHTLGSIPEHQQHEDRGTLARNIHSYFNNGVDEKPLSTQIKHFGKRAAIEMLRNEINSWLSDLRTCPEILSIDTHVSAQTPPLTTYAVVIPPPGKTYSRARTFNSFCATFAPKLQANGQYLIEPDDVPADADPRLWWTIVDHDPSGSAFYLEPGFRRANRLGHVVCERAWGGSPDDHPLYIFREQAPATANT